MKRLTNKELERLAATKIDDVNYGIDELDNEYIEISCGGEVERIPYNEENRLWVIRMLKGKDRTAQDVSLSLATLNCKL